VITVALIAGLCGFWFWTVLNDDEGILAPLNRLFQKNRYTLKFMRCPWCSGAWFALIPSLLLFHDDLIPAVVTGFAAAAITGMLGSYFQGD
jgi:hypothetical protein